LHGDSLGLSGLFWVNMSNANTYDIHNISKAKGHFFVLTVLLALVFTGCSSTPTKRGIIVSETSFQQRRLLRYLDSEQCNLFLGPLGLRNIKYIPVTPGANLVFVQGTSDQLRKAIVILDVVDSPEDYCIENLGAASSMGALPSYEKIETTLGNISIGTFNKPPSDNGGLRTIIDTQGDSILAFIPVRYSGRLHKLMAREKALTSSERYIQTQSEPEESLPEKLSVAVPTPSVPQTPEQETESNYVVITDTADYAQRHEKSTQLVSASPKPLKNLAESRATVSSDSDTGNKSNKKSPKKLENNSKQPKTFKIIFKHIPNSPENTETKSLTDRAVPDNGEDLIDITLPETITLIQLLDLAGKHMGLNYVYDPREIGNQSITLKLHGNLQGTMKVKNLYALLETILGNLGLAMIRQEKDLVTVVKIEKALETQPELVDTRTSSVQVGDTIVTRAFNIQYADILSVITLLEDMKLSVAVTAFEKADLLLVTCHADRMNRVEQLVEMIDRPDEPIECWFRRLDYTAAGPLIVKIRILAQELEGIAVTATSRTTKKPGQPNVATALKPVRSTAAKSVYLDIDERTNRILMIGYPEELKLIEQLVDTLDVAQADARSAYIYNIDNISAEQVLEKLQKLEVLKASGSGIKAASKDTKTNADGGGLTDEPLVSVLEATNQLLVRATPDQHAQISEFLDYIDVAPESIRILAYYEIENIDAAAAKRILEELDLISAGVRTVTSSYTPGPNEPVSRQSSRTSDKGMPDVLTDKPQVVVSESTNSLLVKATKEQHDRLARIIKYIDRKAANEKLSYHIYPVENSSPEHISDMLERLISETIKEDKEGKIEKAKELREQITIVPDSNTYSLVVHASQKNHEWIENLITKLDMRRPQVLIDVTLVEVTRTDTFEYDLNLVANAKDAVIGNIALDPIQKVDSRSRLEAGFNLLDQDGNPTGQTKAFYSDEKVQALLTAIQRKNYGRVLAKPKILVDDGQEGQIITTDETTYVKESIQIPQTGTPITTRDFVPIQASIELQITPHISEGNLLRLAVNLSRDDFGTRPLSGAPPDKATSKVTTTVFVPDNHTVILGGLVKLNQSKGGSKIPLLGDIPVVGGLFRSVGNSDVEKKLYVFLKANIVRPYNESRLADLQKISDEHQEAFEKSESEFQKSEDIPGIPPALMRPERILKDYR